MLEIEGLSAGYGGIPVLNGVTIRIETGEFAAIVGPNGAGKTTLFKTISGIVRSMAGSVRFLGKDLLAVSPFARPHLGIAHVPEGRQVFPSLTVFENLQMGAYTDAGRAAWKQNLEKIYSWFPVLAERAKAQAGALSGGQQQMLAIARGLASSPKLLMLDEPSMGLAPMVISQIFKIIADINAQGTTVLLVEQNAQQALTRSDRAYILETGEITREGNARELLEDDSIRAAYLGVA